MDKKEAVKTSLYCLLGFVIYLIILGLINILGLYDKEIIFLDILSYLNNTIIVVFLITALLFLILAFDSMKYPQNLPAPLFTAVIFAIISWMILEILSVINLQVNSIAITFLTDNTMKVCSLIGAFVLIVGYIMLIRDRD